MKQNGDIIEFLKKKNYVMLNNNLGSGAFGETVLLKDSFINELFVAKKYNPKYEPIKQDFFQNFLDEIKILYKINHPNIVRIYNYYAYEEIYTGFILMEYIDGITLDRYFGEKFNEYSEKVNADELFIQLINAFCYLEEIGIIHRDIRERNIMVQVDGTVKVIDFGIGKFIDKTTDDYDSLVSKINRNNVVLLPDEYHSKTYTSLTDMFYLGELLTRLIKQNDCIHFSYQDVLDKMRLRNPDDRYKNFAEIKGILDKRDFNMLNISTEDKRIYTTFVNSLRQAISKFVENFEFNNSPTDVLNKLEKVLTTNLFEEFVQNNADIIRIFVKNGYYFKKDNLIACSSVQEFFYWFKNSTQRLQEIILSNIKTKLSTVIIVEEDDMPF